MSRRTQLGGAQADGDALAAQAAATAAQVTASAAIPKSVVSAAGGVPVATGAATVAEHAAPTVAGQVMVADPAAGDKFTNGYPLGAANAFDLPTSALAETMQRGLISSITLAALTSAQLFMVAVPLVKGQIVANISFLSGSTALNTGTNQWFALFSAARVQRAISADDTSTAWGANTVKTLAMTAAYTIPTSGLYYLGCMVKATIAVPTLAGVLVPNTTALNLPPIIAGNADAGLTNPASCPSTAGAITVAATVPYAYAS